MRFEMGTGYVTEEAATPRTAARARTPASLQRLREEMVRDKEKNYGGEMMASLMRCAPRH